MSRICIGPAASVASLFVSMAAGLCLFAVPVLSAPPAGFQTNLIIDTGLSAPTGLGIAPDGRIFIVEQGGKIKIYKNGALLPRVFDELPAFADSDRGLLGIAFDPDFSTNKYIYFYYVGTDLAHRVVRFSAAGDIATDGPVEIYHSHSVAGSNHAGGTIQFGPDGALYIGIGDSGQGTNAQNLGNPMGKILRINKDGMIPADNPFVGQAGKSPEIWAYGFRNPFRFNFDSLTGNLYAGDVGQDTWEEINLVTKGTNYGWPTLEGVCATNCSGFADPLYAYKHVTPGYSVTGGPVYRADYFPADYKGTLFFADYAKGFIKTLDLATVGSSTSVRDFDLNAGSVVDLKVAPDGSLYYVTIFPGKLYRVVYTAGNQYPIAASSATPSSGSEPLSVAFSSVGSADPEGEALTYLWDFGDGTQSTSTNPVKTYDTPGVFTVVLKVSDGTNTAQANSLTINVGMQPHITLTSPVAGATYKAGDTITYEATATDAAGNALPDTAFTREIIFHHNTHIHPFLRPLQSRVGTFTIPTTGEVSADTWYEVVMTATDSKGLSATASTLIYPKKADVALATIPAGLQVTVGGIPYTGTSSIQAVVGFDLELDAPTQTKNGIQYEFDHWLDSTSKKRTIRVPDAGAAYTAGFKQSTPFKGEYFNNVNLAGTPALTRDDQNIAFIWNGASPDPIITPDNFSARWTKQQFFPFGRYTFTALTDDGVRLFVDGNQVINNWKDQGETAVFATVDLTEGMHDIKMEYYDRSGGAIAKLAWDLAPNQPTPPPTYPDFKGEYFDNQNLTGTPKLVRNDHHIDFAWGHTSPDPVLPVDKFSVRWTKRQTFVGGAYQFSVTADDGVRLMIDGEKIIDGWKDQSATAFSATKTLTDGLHDIVLEYYEKAGGALIDFAWTVASTTPHATSTDMFAAEYFANTKLSGAPALSRNETAINFMWDQGSPDPIVPTDQFSARWHKNEFFEEGDYEFAVTADDGVRLVIDDELVIDQWKDQAATTYRIVKHMSAGEHAIHMEYFESFGGAVAVLTYRPVAVSAPGFVGQYFANMNLQGSPALVRKDSDINFIWNAGSPDPAIPTDRFSVRWTRQQDFAAGTYTFTTKSDDGIRVYIDNQLIINDWTDHALKQHQAQVALSAGLYTIKVEYYEKAGGSIVTLTY